MRIEKNFLFAAAIAALIGWASACSSGGHTCDSSQCAAGNQCIDDGSGDGAQCHKVCTAQAQCPPGWTCNDGVLTSKAGVNWCARDTAQSDTEAGAQDAFPPPLATGQWASACTAGKGEENNPGCDSADGFACYAQSPTDTSAFCTRFGCAQDSDCPGTWWCATVNQAPNATTATGTLGPTRTVCVPRTYCSPCAEDHDCSLAFESGATQQHCVADVNGTGFCAPQCATDANCALDATCTPKWTLCSPAAGGACSSDEDCPPANGTYQHCSAGQCTPECGSAADCSVGQSCKPVGVCTPRAQVCVGDGSFCSPCRSDDDCPTGYCFTASPYSTEHFCTTVDHGACNEQAMNAKGCPTVTASDNWKAVMCVNTSSQPVQAECYGVVTIGTSAGASTLTPGCWTVNR